MILNPVPKLLTALIIFLLPMSAWAIGNPNTNFFLKGLYHTMMVPAHLIILFALGLLSGQQGLKTTKSLIPVFTGVLGISLVITRYHAAFWNAEWLLLALAVVTSILVILKLNVKKVVSLTIAVLSAVVIGMDSAAPIIPGLQPTKIFAHLAGSGIFSSLLLLLICLLSLALRKLFDGVILRVLGAWATAVTALVITFLLITHLNT